VGGFGRPGLPIRLVVGLHYLKYAYNESDESVVERFLENPYWQYFCGFEYFQHEFPFCCYSFSYRFTRRLVNLFNHRSDQSKYRQHVHQLSIRPQLDRVLDKKREYCYIMHQRMQTYFN